ENTKKGFTAEIAEERRDGKVYRREKRGCARAANPEGITGTGCGTSKGLNLTRTDGRPRRYCGDGPLTPKKAERRVAADPESTIAMGGGSRKYDSDGWDPEGVQFE
ncbi:MAG: hypothetical protein J7M12_02305, partial [Candidatus Hydrogenedentes bacterium]|nr:hypothetical protein [Candidatus Hydrogenedentota bacterium]